MQDSPYVFDGGPAWTVERALDLVAQYDDEQNVAIAHRELETAMAPAPSPWFAKRLPVLWTLFMAARAADPRALTIWMAETAALLGDLPHDIVAHSIDQAIKSAAHGFMPSVGEIRQIADPLVAEREAQIARLCKMAEALNDPEATAERVERRREQALRAQYARNAGDE